jgi:AbiV family abortive infection protein
MAQPKRRPLTQYVGTLTPSQAANGIAAACETARELVKDSELLLEHGRWARAAALAILAIEEAGKPAILRSPLLVRDDAERKEEWRNYRTHTAKSVLAGMQELVSRGARSLDDFGPLFAEHNEHSQNLDAVKQIGFYSEAAGSRCNWSMPSKVITESFASGIVELAKIMADSEEPLSSEAELELFVRHMGPVWKGPMYEMKQALAACYADAEAAGVLRGKHSAREMTRFLFGVSE